MIASMVRVDVSTRLIKWARERSGQPAGDLTKAFPRLSEWEAGDLAPTLRQLEAFAKRTHTPFGYFFLAEPPDERLPIPSFRTQDDGSPQSPSPDLLDTVYEMVRRQDWMRERRHADGWDRLDYVGSGVVSASPADVASQMRQVLGLGDDWAARLPSWQAALGHLRARAEAIGVLVMVSGIVGNNTHRTLDPKEFRGFVLADDIAPLVFINGADAKAAQIFTLAHELAHVWFNLSAAFDLRGLMSPTGTSEESCNLAAAELLVPRSLLMEAWEDARGSDEPFQRLARQFKVSRIVVARRLLDLRVISRDEFFAFYNEYLNEGVHRSTGSSGGDFIINLDYKLGRPFATAVVSAAREGGLLYSEAYELLGARGETFEKLASRIGWGQ